MLIPCNNKGCLKSSNALLNEETKEVICQECGKVISGVTDPMKRTLKSYGQIIRSRENKAFLLLCKHCRGNREVVLNEKNETVCKVCHEPISVTTSFKLAMEAAGLKMEKIVEKDSDKIKKTEAKVRNIKNIKQAEDNKE